MNPKLIFTHGVMGSAKTVNLLIKGYAYTTMGKNVVYIKPAIDNRDVFITSRTGLKHECLLINNDSSVFSQIEKYHKDKIDVILVDEAQFMSEEQIDELADIVYTKGITIMCYGLKADFMQKLFPGSKRLIEISDELHYIESFCSCGREATVNSRYDSNGKLITDGEQVCIGGDDKYKAICRHCFTWLKNK